jgi:hypothetical protein
MRRLFTALVVLAVLVAAFAVIGGTLPEGNLLHDATEGLRAVGRNIADGFGGGRASDKRLI